MKPAPFEYRAPGSFSEALALLADGGGEEVRLIAGGQSLLPLMNLRLAKPDTLVDIRGLEELRGVSTSTDTVTIGAGSTHATIERSSELGSVLPLLPSVAGHIAHPAIRTRGTFGGSLAHADPSAEWPAVACALDARLHLVSDARGSRWVAAREFFRGFFETVLATDEILKEVEIRRPDSRTRWAFREFARQAGAFATVVACVVASVEDDGTVRKIAIALGGCEETTRTFTDGQLSLAREPLSEDTVKAVAQQIASDIAPLSDIHATGLDRRQLARTLVERALRDLGSTEQALR
jgi:carbon-monoxide dehydrogenase medium subunit